MDLNAKDHRQVPAVSMSFFANNINSFAVGCEDGFLFVGDRHGTKGEMSRSIRGKLCRNWVERRKSSGPIPVRSELESDSGSVFESDSGSDPISLSLPVAIA